MWVFAALAAVYGLWRFIRAWRRESARIETLIDEFERENDEKPRPKPGRG